MSIGQLLKEERTKNNLSQEDVARAIGSTKQAVYKYEMGIVTNIPMDKIEKMARLFGVTPSYLMGWDNAKTNFNLQLFAEEKPTAKDDELSDNVRKLIEFCRTVPDDKAEMILRVMKSIVEGD